MNIIELIFVAVSLSLDAFAAAVCIGLSPAGFSMRKALAVGLWFGLFQAAMPLIGYFAAVLFSDKVAAYAHWIAFFLLLFLGAKMIAGSFRGKNDTPPEGSLKPAYMLPLAVATSIDALAAGGSFALLRVPVIPAVLLVGGITLALSAAGVKIGSIFGTRFAAKAEFAGGVVLILIGVNILLEHTGVRA
jgi:putative Mn2+ efflux pump MntP